MPGMQAKSPWPDWSILGKDAAVFQVPSSEFSPPQALCESGIAL
jgi:hypothetical protein